MRHFRVRLTTNVNIERFVTVAVSDDDRNPDIAAKVLANDESRKNGQVWTVLGSTPDRLGDLETVRIGDVSRLPSSIFMGDAEELTDGVEILRVTSAGSERVAFFPENANAEGEASRQAEAEVKRLRAGATSLRVSYILQDTFGA